jgi:hypothetical protein
MQMTDRAKTALLGAGGRRGAKVPGTEADQMELEARGLVTRDGNLTERGVTARSKILDQALDEAFGG